MACDERGVPDQPPASDHRTRRIIDLLPASFAIERSESEWLMTLLAADELAYIFGDDRDGEAKD